MTFINMLSWWQWLALAAVPPAIVLLYFLKLKRTPLEVPSTFLWRKSIEDLHVNSLWQRLRTSLLLLLQLVLVALVMIALVRPGWSGNRLLGHRYVFLIDNSASMQARDVEPTRLDEAKGRASELVEQMRSGDVAMIVSFADEPRVEQVFTDNRRELLRQLQSIRPTEKRTSIEEALRVASGFASVEKVQDGAPSSAASQPATLYLFSDGRFPDVPDLKLGKLNPIFVPIGAATAENVAITSFTTRRREDDESRMQAFGRIQNFGTTKQAVAVDLYLDDNLLDSTELEVAARQSEGVLFELGEMTGSVLRLVVRSGGALAVDDQAWTAVDPPQRNRVLFVTSEDPALVLAASTESARELADVEVHSPDILTTEDYQQRAAAGHWALIVYDNCAPRELPQANTLFIGKLPPGGQWRAKGDAPETSPQIIDVELTHPLMQLIDLGNVRFVEATILAPPPGSSSLITTTTGPLFAIAPRGIHQDAVLGAPLVGVDPKGERYANTDWPLRVSFPVFVLNTLRFLGGADAANSTVNVAPGQPVNLISVAGAGSLNVLIPGGKAVEVAGEGGRYRFSQTGQLGAYTIQEKGQPARHFTVNLFDPGESDIAPRDEVRLGAGEVTGQATWEGGRTELWRWLLGAVLGVLCLEWYIYNRRVHV